MTTQSPSIEIQQLGRAVADLAAALARSERRYAHMARILRWGTLGLVSLLVFGGFLIAERTGIAFAEDQGGLPQATSTVEALNNINANLMVFGAVGKGLNKFMPALAQAVMGNKDVEEYVKKYVEGYSKEHNVTPTPEQQEQIAMQAIIESAVGTLVDAIVLLQRIRDDSNAFRDWVPGPEQALRGIDRELAMMNAALTSVPAMAVQMDLMNRHMASMSYSMGTSMGRMGKWMPW